MTEATFSTFPKHDVALVIGGSAYLGWTSVEIDRGIDTMVGTFALELTAKEKTGGADFPITEDDACQVVLGGEALITGWIDKVDRTIDKENRTISVTGRDKACDLVDCSALNKPGSWTKTKLDTIAKALASPFNVTVTFTADLGQPLTKFAIQPGETAWAAIERLARYRGLIAFSDGKGGVIIGNPDTGKRGGRIKLGDNLLSLTTSRDNSQRFSQYVIKGQASGTKERHGKVVAQIKGEATDAGVKRYRPMLIVGEEQSDAANLKKRAQWEATVRAGKAETATAIVPGWFTGADTTGKSASAGPVWEPGSRADCQVPSEKFTGDRLIERVKLTRNADDGTLTELTLVPPSAWTQLAENEKTAA